MHVLSPTLNEFPEFLDGLLLDAGHFPQLILCLLQCPFRRLFLLHADLCRAQIDVGQLVLIVANALCLAHGVDMLCDLDAAIWR